ncbi:helix-turn-helix domain-containing protein [Microbispora bryophytorum]|nr:helix-turn-helix domain-containing protein [Microbispora bryophytorum]TQS04274.1 helix-turn-helix domain-containing protein [Microbispora bryophytorum]
MSTDDLPPDERFRGWLDHISRMVAPVRAACDDPVRFTGSIAATDLGAIQVSSHMVSGCEGFRTPRMIRRSDPELFQLMLGLSGRTIVAQDQRVAELRPSELVLCHTSRPCRWVTGEREPARGLLMVFPGTLLPFPRHQAERLTATSLSARGHFGGLLGSLLTTLATDAASYATADAVRLGAVLMDLVTALLAHRIQAGAAVPPEARGRTLLLSVQEHIQRHLADPRLSPATIAAAHNISLRTLHRLFESQETTVAASIRAQRLERCRRDLSDPSLAGRPIHATASRWGFSDTATFVRAFRAAYGQSPLDYRLRYAAAGEGEAAGLRATRRLPSSPRRVHLTQELLPGTAPAQGRGDPREAARHPGDREGGRDPHTVGEQAAEEHSRPLTRHQQ